MDMIAGIAFLLSGFTNGADLTIGVGYAQDNNVLINPIGIFRLETPIYSDKADNWKMALKATHLSSIPDRFDKINGTEINMASIEFSVKIR